MEMPSSWAMKRLSWMLSAGQVTMARIDDSVTRILWPLVHVGAIDGNWSNAGSLLDNVTTVGHVELARRIAAESTVLLRNKGGVLPLSTAAGRSVVVVGGQATSPIVNGGGSGGAPPCAGCVPTPLDSIRRRLAIPPGAACDAGQRCVLYAGGSADKATELAVNASAVVIFVGTTSWEGADRGSLALPMDQSALITTVARAAGSKTVVVAVTPGPLLTPWRDDVAAVVTPMMPGQEYGNAISQVLFGDVNPGGKLPVTFPAKENETGLSHEQWPGLPASNVSQYATYTERLEVGYRWYAAHEIEPAFAFGAGLSYTAFGYTGLSTTTRPHAAVSCEVRNTGDAEGTEVVQLYLRFPDAAGEPPKQLKGFRKLTLRSGEVRTVSFELDDRAFSVWDVAAHAWTIVPGEFGVMVGSSSADIRLIGTIHS